MNRVSSTSKRSRSRRHRCAVAMEHDSEALGQRVTVSIHGQGDLKRRMQNDPKLAAAFKDLAESACRWIAEHRKEHLG